MPKRLLICAVCIWLGGCSVTDDFVFSDFRTNLDRQFETLGEMAEGARGIAEAGTAAVRPVGHLKKTLDSLGEPATRSGSEPLPVQAADPAPPEALPDGKTVRCGPLAEGPQSAVLGDFTAERRQTRLFLTFDCRIRHEDGPEADDPVSPDHASLMAVCRDPVSGRDQAVFRTGGGTSSADVQVWGVDPASSAVRRLYVEGWADMREWLTDTDAGDYDKRELDRLVAGDGTCLWRNRQEARDTVKAAIAAFRACPGEECSANREVPTALPARSIPAGTARKWLTALERFSHGVILEGAVYADEGARASWRIVQVLSTTRYEWDGALLVFDRRAGTWQSILDVSLDYPMSDMVVKGDRLFAAICVDGCYHGHGYASDAEYEALEVDLRTKRATLLQLPWSDDPPRMNPPIRNVQEEILSQ